MFDHITHNLVLKTNELTGILTFSTPKKEHHYYLLAELKFDPSKGIVD